MKIIVEEQVMNIGYETTLLEVLKNNNVAIKNNCEGNCACGQCLVAFEKSLCESLKIDDEELDVIEKQSRATKYARLACQVKIKDLRAVAENKNVIVKVI
jgi:ferredoxin